MQDEHFAFFNQLNKKIDEINELTKNYNTQANKLHDVIPSSEGATLWLGWFSLIGVSPHTPLY
jgi:hypothetical protein